MRSIGGLELVPELTRSAGIQLNKRVSLQRRVVACTSIAIHPELIKLQGRLAALTEARAHFVAQMLELNNLRDQVTKAQLSARRPQRGRRPRRRSRQRSLNSLVRCTRMKPNP